MFFAVFEESPRMVISDIFIQRYPEKTEDLQGKLVNTAPKHVDHLARLSKPLRLMFPLQPAFISNSAHSDAPKPELEPQPKDEIEATW